MISIASPNLASATPNTDNPTSPTICPIGGSGTDAGTPAIDTTNETTGSPGLIAIDGTQSIAAAKNTAGKSIGDQLVEAGQSWKTYQESLPLGGPDLVNSQPTESSPTIPTSQRLRRRLPRS